MMVLPRFNAAMEESKLNGAVSELVAGLEYARSLAVQYQKPFQVRAYRYDYPTDKANQFLIKDVLHVGSAIDLDAQPPLYTYTGCFTPSTRNPTSSTSTTSRWPWTGSSPPGKSTKGSTSSPCPGAGTTGI